MFATAKKTEPKPISNATVATVAPRVFTLGSGEVINECLNSQLISITTDRDLTASGDIGTGRQLYDQQGTELRIVKIEQLTDVFSIVHMIPSAVLDARRS